MQNVKLHLDMADRELFEPYTTIDVQADTSDVELFYPPFDRRIHVARLLYDGRELVLYTAREGGMPWSKGFSGIVADLGGVSWSEALARGFAGVLLEARGKAFVELAS